jgi:hypothetical protein
MLKKAGAVVAIAAGMMMLGSPAFAEDGPNINYGPLVSALNGNNVNAVVGACGNNIAAGLIAVAVPVNSPAFTETCAAGGIVDGDDVNMYND